MKLWKLSLVKSGNSKLAETIADSIDNAHLFPGLEESITSLDQFKKLRNKSVPADRYNNWKVGLGLDLIDGIFFYVLETKIQPSEEIFFNDNPITSITNVLENVFIVYIFKKRNGKLLTRNSKT